MTAHYVVDIQKDDAHWGRLHIEHPRAEAALTELLQALRAQGYTCRPQVAVGERRLVESSPAGVTLLFREPVLQPLSDH